MNYFVNHLVVMAGLTPQVITEALYVLHVREHRVVTRISIITSSEGAEAVENALLLTRDPPMDQFCRDYGLPRSNIRFGLEDLHRVWPSRMVETGVQSVNLDALMTLMAEWCADGEPPVTACVAGGRKDMAVLFAQVFSLLARPEDRLGHLLVSPQFENLAEFFYPPPHPEILAVHRSGGVTFLNSADARVELLEIPLIRLRSLLDEETRRGLVSLETARQRVQMGVENLDLTLRLQLASRQVTHGGRSVVLPPREFAVLLFFARVRHEGVNGGWIPTRVLDESRYVTALSDAYRNVMGYERISEEDGIIPYHRNGTVNYSELKLKVTHAISKIKSRLGVAHPGRVQSRPARGGKEYGLDMDSRHLLIDEA
ncbi:MAG: TIGR02584 family CRISPR-associated protein [Magnetococcales bacterium]|nr:TIGR02584 family CRISPR-associated protein [Magnetococcales bacterium]